MAEAAAENQEPSMEEILASIRKIISEDGATLEAAPPPEDTDVLDLIQEVKEDGSLANLAEAIAATPPPPQTAEPLIDMEDAKPPAPSPQPVTAPPAARVTLPEDSERLLSDTAAQASAAAMGDLNRLKNGQPAIISSLPLGEGSRTVEDIVIQMIRPMLKEWLDKNLPAIVEHIVQKEVRKITRDIQQ